MAFQYYGANMPMQGMGYYEDRNPFAVTQEQPQQAQPQQGQQMDPTQIMGLIKSIMGGSGGAGAGMGSTSIPLAGQGAAGAGGSVGMSPVTAGGSGAGSAAGSTGGLWSGMGSFFSNPWTWLGAVIVGNELYSKKRGYRADDTVDWIKDAFSGEVLHQDIEKKFLPRLGVKEGSKTSKLVSHLIQPISADIPASYKRLKGIFK